MCIRDRSRSEHSTSQHSTAQTTKTKTNTNTNMCMHANSYTPRWTDWDGLGQTWMGWSRQTARDDGTGPDGITAMSGGVHTQ
eukprot:9649780-Alexandrium_andersonii.AAC.1